MRSGRHSPTYTELLALQTDGSLLTIGSKLVPLPLSEFQMIDMYRTSSRARNGCYGDQGCLVGDLMKFRSVLFNSESEAQDSSEP